MAFQQTSPAESFLSAPGDSFPSLFGVSTPSSATTTMNPMEMMTPQSFTDEKLESCRLSVIAEQSSEAEAEDDNNNNNNSNDSIDSIDSNDNDNDNNDNANNTAALDAESPSTLERKPAKKRKSWGQVLPEPKTNLPPRKRAKTEDEKEQRRVERVLRNRRAAQSSRERKRLEVEALEKRNKELETLLINAQKTNLMLVEELNRFRRSSGVVTRSPSSPLSSLQDSITLSQQLFSSQDDQQVSAPQQSLMDQIMRSAANPTVNPASLSPELNPMSDSTAGGFSDDLPSVEAKDEADEGGDEDGHQTLGVSTNSTQLVVAGLPGSGANYLGLDSMPQDDAPFSLSASFGLSAAIDADRYVLESGLLASPNPIPIGDDYLAGDSAAGFANHPEFDLFDINDFLNDDANNVASDIVAAGDYAAAEHGLDFETCDPETQISSDHPIQQPQPGAISAFESRATRGDRCELIQSLRSVALPSREVLLTLLWALKVEQGKIRQKQAALLDPGRSASADQQQQQQQQSDAILKIAGMKRIKTSRLDYSSGSKRSRLSR
ncbi:transcriptional activator hac1 [Trichoderma cornu-damae]|uniref:Transcriptional activator hac1 n=1 Tax=Trichoderma cornu-damae TaxID=654480 RepID=A0A9P8QQV1_9HYPO|nr:transcriptional activator hac1 [Trichoderma cornu-damae]